MTIAILGPHHLSGSQNFKKIGCDPEDTMAAQFVSSTARLGIRAVAALAILFVVQEQSFGFGWGMPLPPLLPLPGDVKDDPAPPLDELPPIDPVDPIGDINNGDDLPAPNPVNINDIPEPATMITGLIGAGVLGIAAWWRKKQVRPPLTGRETIRSIRVP